MVPNSHRCSRQLSHHPKHAGAFSKVETTSKILKHGDRLNFKLQFLTVATSDQINRNRCLNSLSSYCTQTGYRFWSYLPANTAWFCTYEDKYPKSVQNSRGNTKETRKQETNEGKRETKKEKEKMRQCLSFQKKGRGKERKGGTGLSITIVWGYFDTNGYRYNKRMGCCYFCLLHVCNFGQKPDLQRVNKCTV